ncbi:protein CHLOROPLAST VESICULATION [Cornus florida]|uniref:protein CHLOROPLAST VESICULATION n=1 Tax=Cornus florida TaxID=4283 RepID=UPI0028A0FA5B|nr:protein CHLOROPLAST VESICULATION [Cornus florida]
MAVCSLNLSPPSSTSNPPSLPISKTTPVARPCKERSWRSQCVVGVACMMMGLEMSNLVMVNQERAIAQVMQSLVQSNDQKVNRWSDKRSCQPWRLNSLETIVPENLPRPSARRRWESVGHTSLAPAVKVTLLETNSKCFSL